MDLQIATGATALSLLLAVDVGESAVGEHGEQVSGAREHEGEGVLLIRQVAERLVGVAEEVHQRRPQEHPPGELGPQDQERLVPLQKVRGHATGERADEDQDEAPDLGEDQGLGPQVNVLVLPGGGGGVPVVVAPAMGGGGEEEGQEEGEEEEEGARHRSGDQWGWRGRHEGGFTFNRNW